MTVRREITRERVLREAYLARMKINACERRFTNDGLLEIRPSTGSGRPEPVEGRFTKNALSGDFATNRHE